MEDYKRLVAGIGCREGRCVDLDSREVLQQPFLSYVLDCNNTGADGVLVWDLSETDGDHEQTIRLIKEAARLLDIQIITGGQVKRLEDVKKYLYAGAKAVFLDGGNEDNIDLIKEAADRFGSEKIYMCLTKPEQAKRIPEFHQLGASVMLLAPEAACQQAEDCCRELQIPFLACCRDSSPEVIAGTMGDYARGVVLSGKGVDGEYFMDLKQQLTALGRPVDILRSRIPWSDFRVNGDGLIPVIVQDYKTSQVLMLAYMNEQAYQDTLFTGKMHYYSRSRKSQWLKGETSGHFQYVKALYLDCDNDTILARVHQIGAACHTGEKSCFFQPLVEKEYREVNPLKVFEDVFAVIQDRKIHPKEGSYTNYLFDKGIDKILKKVGEEATEIVIAAKNPDPEEIKYEISDFLYHVMVLMAEKGVTWEEITEELANR
ncbi:MAG: bifunctional phosphoribosyl-AMP cyclohydrolase/phosphoribosyl-ATP diphosphatase HisIE [Eubacteriales bacterium]|nr:bifunctional phosphoribosyl-AMP cyclohydrolase/phosphoribosyl-ATP diphosphatase HisIE [Eubacteriales bacterium]